MTTKTNIALAELAEKGAERCSKQHSKTSHVRMPLRASLVDSGIRVALFRKVRH